MDDKNVKNESEIEIKKMDDKKNVSVENELEIEIKSSRRSTKAEEKIEARKRKLELEKKEASERREAALTQMRYMLSVCEEYSEIFKKSIESQKTLKEKNKNYVAPTLGDVKNIKEEVKVKPRKANNLDITQHLKYFKGDLRPYQIEGVTWLYMLYANATNGILADEMGLGKTIQIIALLSVLLEQKVTGPYLIVVPLSTIPNWVDEFKKFAPQIPVVPIVGLADNRFKQLKLIRQRYKVGDIETYPVVLATFQTPVLEFKSLNVFKWRYIIVDEGHKIKNHQSILSQKLRELKSSSRLILTGTPLQNNMMELWSLLNFLLPNFFTNMSTFTDLFFIEDMRDENKIIQEEQSTNLVSKIHKVLAPFMLRRQKKDVLLDMVPKKEVVVYCPLSPLQLKLYDYVIDRSLRVSKKEPQTIDIDEPRAKRKCTMNRKIRYDIPLEDDLDFDALETDIKINENDLKEFSNIITRFTLASTLMMFRKIVNHPYLVQFPLDPNSKEKRLLVNEELVTSSGKLLVLDTLLPQLKERGHKLLLFSQFCMTLDIIEEYVLMRNYNYCRLDGCQNIEKRSDAIKMFNEDPNVFMFLISTRAGGLGLNLIAADTVIFFDRDWNPQMDIQAQDRCHRIGQTKPVVVYTLVAKNTIDEAIIGKGKLKRVLEKVVISDGKFKTIVQEDKSKTEDILVELRQALRQSNEDTYIFSNKMELDKLLDRSDLYEQMKMKPVNEEPKKAQRLSKNKNKENQY